MSRTFGTPVSSPSAIKEDHGFGREPVAARQKIDFIFVTPDIVVNSSTIYQDRLYDPQRPETAWGYISDHNPVMAEVEF
ncbi:MAG: hypothetical protein LUC49_00195 [Prevotella sp.]|nr:hypothetical protein [Prevotella sp.]